MTVLENLGYGVKAKNGQSASSLINAAVERFELGGLTLRPVQQLSGGERQRIALARAAIAAVSLGSGDDPAPR